MNSPDWGCSPALFFYPTFKTSLPAFSAYELRIIFPRTNAGIRCSYFSRKARWGEDSILNTSARIAGKALALGGVEGIHRLDKPNRADGDHVILCAVPGIVFFADMRDEPQIVADQRIPRLCGGCPSLLQIGKGRALPVRRERTREGPAFEMQRQIQNMPCRRLQKQTKNAQHTHHLAEVYAGHGNSILSFGWRTPGWRRGSPCRRRFGAVQRRGARRRGRPHGR